VLSYKSWSPRGLACIIAVYTLRTVLRLPCIDLPKMTLFGHQRGRKCLLSGCSTTVRRALIFLWRSGFRSGACGSCFNDRTDLPGAYIKPRGLPNLSKWRIHDEVRIPPETGISRPTPVKKCRCGICLLSLNRMPRQPLKTSATVLHNGHTMAVKSS
jgi:hypothetical protein